jgi:hypothetical protein
MSDTQNADFEFIANECIESRLRVICKLDIKKAYNQVNWECLLFLLSKCVLLQNGDIGSSSV